MNLREVELAEDTRAREGHRVLRRMLGQEVAAKATGFSVYELPPGEAAWPYHWELSREEWLIVITGEVVVRTPSGDVAMHEGDVRCFPIGPAGAHQVRNDSSVPARFAMPSSFSETYVAVRPDTNVAFVVGPGFRQIVSLEQSLDYWDREP